MQVKGVKGKGNSFHIWCFNFREFMLNRAETARLFNDIRGTDSTMYMYLGPCGGDQVGMCLF